MEAETITVKYEKLLEEFLGMCEKQEISMDRNFALYYLHLLNTDFYHGLDMNMPLTHCRLHLFLKRALEQYVNPLNATTINIKLCYQFSKYTAKHINIHQMRFNYKQEFDEQLDKLIIKDILQYPETSNHAQVEQIIHKICIFTILAYSLGSPKSLVLQDILRGTINNIITPCDIRNFVLKKKYNRLEYLIRLAATVAGIVIYNNENVNAQKENIRQIFTDIEMACKSTQEALQTDMKRFAQCSSYAQNSVEEIIRINVQQKKVYCHTPIVIMQEVNSFTALYCVCQRQLQILNEAFEKTQHLIECDKDKFRCMVNKIDDVLKYRTAIEAELIFPYFVHLSELWYNMTLYLRHLAFLNKKRDEIAAYMTECLDVHFYELVAKLKTKSYTNKTPTEPNFLELLALREKRQSNFNLTQLPEHVKDFCGLTLVLTGGLLTPATVQKKLCENLNLRFGFRNFDYVKYAERHFRDFVRSFAKAIFMNVDLILLFELYDKLFNEQTDTGKAAKTTCDFNGQTEMLVTNNLSPTNWLNVTWNIWDFYRETIHLADLRKRQTHSMQTIISYGQRNAQNQTYNTRDHFVWTPTEASTDCH